MRRLLAILVLCSGCRAEVADGPGWRLVGAYDAAALLALGKEDAGGIVEAWEPTEAMVRSCGPTKQPDGLGFFEAEAVLGGHTPTLALLLERTGAGVARPLTPSDVRVSLGEGHPAVPLQPLVAPRRLGVTVTYNSDSEKLQDIPPEVGLVLTQLRAELCLEHKTGRAWIGGTREQIRQAYLLDRPEQGGVGLGGDRRYFVGQGGAVPAMAGPPDACLTLEHPRHVAPSRRAPDGLVQPTQTKGQGSLDLTNTDVWGADLRACDVEPELPTYQLPLRLSASDGQPPVRPPSTRRSLRVALKLSAQEDPRVSLELDGAPLLTDAPLYGPEAAAEGLDEAPRPTDAPINGAEAGTEEGTERQLVDLLARVPLEYPTMGAPNAQEGADPYRYTLLLVPNWQVAEGLAMLDRMSRSEQSENEPPVSGAPDAVGWILRHPEVLFVQIAPRAALGHEVGGAEDMWWALGGAMVGESWAPRHWGYAVGHLFGRQPIALPGGQEPSWRQTLEAHRGGAHALVLLSVACLLFVVGRGLPRVRDLWNIVPEERVTWWPGVQAPQSPPKPEALAKGEGT